MTEPKRWTALDRRDPRRTGLPTVEVVAATDFDRLRDERDRAIAQREQAAGTRNVIAAERDLAIDRLDAVSRERDRLRDERDRLAERLREMIAVYDRHSRWCGYYAQAPGDSIIQLVPAARSALAVFDTLTEEKTDAP